LGFRSVGPVGPVGPRCSTPIGWWIDAKNGEDSSAPMLTGGIPPGKQKNWSSNGKYDDIQRTLRNLKNSLKCNV